MNQTFKFTDHVHFERNAPDATTDIYYDADESFKKRYEKFILDYERNAANELSANEYLIGLGKGIEETFGALTLGQLLFVVHMVGSRLGQHHGYGIGFQHGSEQMLAQCLDSMSENNVSQMPFMGGHNATA